MNDLVRGLERQLLQQPQVECSVIHRFGPGLYIREVTIPAGTFAIGHYQKTQHMNIMLKGRVTIANANGTTTDLVAPMIYVGNPGRKCGYIHEDVVWQNIYATDETDIEKLEEMYLEKTLEWKEQALLENQVNRLSYKQVLDEYGFTADMARMQSEEESDQIPFPLGSYKVMVSDSQIEGRGLFATATIEEGELIGPARIGGKRTPAGRFTNHSNSPNAYMARKGEDIDLIALRQIGGCKGGLLGEEITIDYRQALSLSLKEPSCQQ